MQTVHPWPGHYCSGSLGLYCRVGLGLYCRGGLGFYCSGSLGLYCRVGLGLYCRGRLGFYCRRRLGLYCRGGLGLYCRGGLSLYCRGGLGLYGRGGLGLYCRGGLSLYCRGLYVRTFGSLLQRSLLKYFSNVASLPSLGLQDGGRAATNSNFTPTVTNRPTLLWAENTSAQDAGGDSPTCRGENLCLCVCKAELLSFEGCTTCMV